MQLHGTVDSWDFTATLHGGVHPVPAIDIVELGPPEPNADEGVFVFEDIQPKQQLLRADMYNDDQDQDQDQDPARSPALSNITPPSPASSSSRSLSDADADAESPASSPPAPLPPMERLPPLMHMPDPSPLVVQKRERFVRQSSAATIGEVPRGSVWGRLKGATQRKGSAAVGAVLKRTRSNSRL
jgi:hypothetical protein